jgi:hypothetical protein
VVALSYEMLHSGGYLRHLFFTAQKPGGNLNFGAEIKFAQGRNLSDKKSFWEQTHCKRSELLPSKEIGDVAFPLKIALQIFHSPIETGRNSGFWSRNKWGGGCRAKTMGAKHIASAARFCRPRKIGDVAYPP